MAILAAAVAVIVLAVVSGASLTRVFAHVHASWLLGIAIATVASFPPYMLAYRQMTTIAGLRAPNLSTVAATVLSGFGPFQVGGGFHLDQSALQAVYGDDRTAQVQVVGLIALEWAVLAPVACLCAVILLASGARVMGSLLWAWTLGVPVGFALGLWLSVPERRRAWLRRIGFVSRLLDGIGLLHRLIRDPLRTAPAWLGMAAYWAAEIVALYASLRLFGVGLSPVRVILAYATGYVVTRRSLPLAGAAFTEVLLTFGVHWLGAPLGPALAAVAAYRLFNLVLTAVPSLIAARVSAAPSNAG